MCTTAYASTVMSELTCKSDNSGTMTHYSYLKEPALERSGYTLGYKTGSFSYLENGTIDFSDKITYYDGQYDSDHDDIDDDRNVTVEHHQYVNFSGVKGISEFYAKGFYPNNRALSAWKKIRYDDIGSYTLYRDNRSYLSNKIVVTADATMGPLPNADGEYYFKWDAKVTNGVVEVKDATGWTNETGGRRIDWEQDALLMGNVSVTNILQSRGLLFPAAGGEEDWLPCCFSGTKPQVVSIDSDDNYWPTKSTTKGVLGPMKQLPDNETCSSEKRITCKEKCNDTYRNDGQKLEYCLGDCEETCKNFTCVDGDCPGFECIYTYSPGEGPWPEGTWTPEEGRGPGGKPIVQDDRVTIKMKIKSINGTAPYDESEAADLRDKLSDGQIVTYIIDVDYTDPEIALNNVNISDTLPLGLNYVPNSATFWFSRSAEAGSISTSSDPESMTLIWHVPVIVAGQALHIQFDTKVTNVNATECLIFSNKAEVEAFVETDTVWVKRTAEIKEAVIPVGTGFDCYSVPQE